MQRSDQFVVLTRENGPQVHLKPATGDVANDWWRPDTLGGRLHRLGVPPLLAAFGQRFEVDVVQGRDQHIRLGGGEELLVVRSIRLTSRTV